MNEEQPDVSHGDPDRLGTHEVDVQQLLDAASRAIAAVRRQAADLYQKQRDLDGEDEETDTSPNVNG